MIQHGAERNQQNYYTTKVCTVGKLNMANEKEQFLQENLLT